MFTLTGVPYQTRFVDVFVRKSDVGNRNLLLIWKKVLIGAGSNLPTFLSIIIFIGQSTARSFRHWNFFQ
ncbi:MAG: hypothetical protein ACKVOS_00005 [Sphingorhabdus sp.]|uniref:hypothetical protein n=1 Tax=Sphingorhabdus sp. TaxID=1902408 RepID=UPI0038FC69CF